MSTPQARRRQQLLKYVDFEMHQRLSGVLKELKKTKEHGKFSHDLGEVQRHLQADMQRPYEAAPGSGEEPKRYLCTHDFAHDVRLVFKNCFLSRLPTDTVFREGRKLCLRFEALLAEVEREAERKGPRCPLRARCQLLLADLRRHPMTEWFRRDADWRALPDYEALLEKGAALRGAAPNPPMDLEAVQARFDAGAYDAGAAGAFSVETLAGDVHMIWQNAIDFNREDSTFGAMAKVLQTSFTQRIADLREAPRPVAEPPPSSQQQQEGCAAAAAAAAAAAEPSNKRRRVALHAACSALPPPAAAELADFVAETCPAAVRRREGQARIHLDRVEPTALCLEVTQRAKALAAAAEPHAGPV